MRQIFQTRVLQHYIDKQDEELLKDRWQNFQAFKDKIFSIKTMKEEKYQDGFLSDIFENCLGYTKDTTNPQEFNLEREKKNEKDSKKVDGAISVDGNVVGYIELKGQNTKDLDKTPSKGVSPVDQAFRYLYSNSSEFGKYVIVSNFDELRFYIKDQTAYEVFSLFNMDEKAFKKLHTILSYESIRSDLPLEIKEKSVNFEVDISNKFYKDYVRFRIELFNNVIKNNAHIDKLNLLNLTQKLIDRIVFILFAEDTTLLPLNTIYKIIEQHKNQDFTDFSLYKMYGIYFEAINSGNEKLNINKYNGGLFAQDEKLNNLVIDDIVLQEQAKVLSAYNFGSDISVNILGHIFEQSISDIEELTASIENVDFDKTKSKRKKDGVFYTPAYITKYIVDHTLGEMCFTKREELDVLHIDKLASNKKPTKKQNRQKENLTLYKTWLIGVKILDPACGSGAFLNQALEFLLEEHKKLQNDFAELGDIFSSYQIDKVILENNLYGVDINESAVEIAKLSLWLKTADNKRPLTKLADKILCANSLLEMPFKEGEFDIVIGNPPYVRVQGLKSNYENEALLYEQKFQSATGKYDLYALFMEMSFKMLKPDGKLSYILPHKFLIADFGSGIREFFVQRRAVESLLHFGSEMVFKDASTYTCIINLSHNNDTLKFKHIKPTNIDKVFEYDEISYKDLDSKKWDLTSQDELKVIKKLQKQPLCVKDVFSNISQGIVSMGDDIYVMRGKFKDNLFIGYSKELECEIHLEKETVRPFLKGEDVKKYASLSTDLYIIYPHFTDENGKTKPLEEDVFKNTYPLAYEYLEQFKALLVERKIKYKTNPKYWYALHRSREISMFENEKIITPEISLGTNMTYDDGAFYHGTKCYTFVKDIKFNEDYKFYLTLLNSSLMWFFLKNTGYELRGGFFAFKTKFLEPFPLPKLNNLQEQDPFVKKADEILSLTKNLQTTKQNFINDLELEKVSKKLQNFESLEFEEFIKELKKAKKLKFKDKLQERNFKDEWRSLFEQDAKTAQELHVEIDKTDKEIDTLVYTLYDLNDEEIAIVEESCNG